MRKWLAQCTHDHVTSGIANLAKIHPCKPLLRRHMSACSTGRDVRTLVLSKAFDT